MDNETIWPCAKCKDGTLTKRQNRKTGEFFLGCSNYPKCSYTQKCEPEDEPLKDAASVWEDLYDDRGFDRRRR